MKKKYVVTLIASIMLVGLAITLFVLTLVEGVYSPPYWIKDAAFGSDYYTYTAHSFYTINANVAILISQLSSLQRLLTVASCCFETILFLAGMLGILFSIYNIKNNKEKQSSSDVIDELTKWKKLFETGVLTQEEFDEKKKVLLQK